MGLFFAAILMQTTPLEETNMERYQTFSEEELLESLIHQYQQYRNLGVVGGTEEELASCKLNLFQIIRELNKRTRPAPLNIFDIDLTNQPE